jgi:hypothetical protein
MNCRVSGGDESHEDDGAECGHKELIEEASAPAPSTPTAQLKYAIALTKPLSQARGELLRLCSTLLQGQDGLSWTDEDGSDHLLDMLQVVERALRLKHLQVEYLTGESQSQLYLLY